MPRLFRALREHRHFFIVVTLLTLATTFPTIVYIFNTDVFWLPTGNWDVFIHLWDTWYGKQVLAGEADRLYTNLMFYPEGIPLNSHQYALPNILAVTAFNLFLPLSNAFSLAWLLIIASCALAAYAYLLWLFEDKWIALFGAVVFAFSPHVAGEPHHPAITYLVPIPLTLYCFHRGVREQRTILVMLAGLIVGLTSIGLLYTCVIILMMLGLYVCALAIPRWRNPRYWQYVAILALVGAISSVPGVYPLLRGSAVTASVLGWYGGNVFYNDAVSFLVNHRHPLFGPLLEGVFSTPSDAAISQTSFLGYLPLLLICVGLINKSTRRLMLPWALLCGIFLILRLGPNLRINGVAYPDILLPKHFLDQIPPGLFRAFVATDQFMAGAVLPLAVLACFGLFALRIRFPGAAKPAVVLALVAIVAFEYYMPVSERIISQDQIAFLDWLRSEEDEGKIRLINLPVGQAASHVYNLYQALSGYPHAEGAISRTPESAFDYIKANPILSAWLDERPSSCQMPGREAYISALSKLEADGFSHVVFHLFWSSFDQVNESLTNVRHSYSDKYTIIARISDLRASCPRQLSAPHQFTDALAPVLSKLSTSLERPGSVAVFPPTAQAGDHFMRYVRHFAQLDRQVVTVASHDEAEIRVLYSQSPSGNSIATLEAEAALWLITGPPASNAEETAAYRDWFSKRFRFCSRYVEEEDISVNLYLRADIPCSAMDASTALEVAFDGGARLHNISHAARDGMRHFYTAWTYNAPKNDSFSLQFFDESGQKALQYDSVIFRVLLSTHAIDISSLAAGAYTVKLIVYDYETQKSLGGTVADSGQRFERELEVARIEL